MDIDTKNDIPFEINKVYSFYDDGKISLSRLSKMKVVEFVNGLYSALRFKWEDDGKIISIWDMWKESLEDDIQSFDSVAHKIYDWGCEDFIICHPIGGASGEEYNEDVVFARMSNGGWYTIGNEWNGKLSPTDLHV